MLSLGGVSPSTPAGMPHSCAWLKNAAVKRLPEVRTALAGLAGYAAGIYSHGTFLSWMRRLRVAAAARDARAPADRAGAGTDTRPGTTHAEPQPCCDEKILDDLEDDLVRLVLVRHGMSIWNKDNRFTAWMDVPLSRHGLDDAQRAGMLCRKAGIRFDMAFTSVLQRAVKTCHMILEEIRQLWIPTVLQICLFVIIVDIFFKYDIQWSYKILSGVRLAAERAARRRPHRPQQEDGCAHVRREECERVEEKLCRCPSTTRAPASVRAPGPVPSINNM